MRASAGARKREYNAPRRHRSGLDAVAGGLRALCDEDLARQLELLGSALDAGAPVIAVADRGPGGEPADSRALWIRGAEALGDHILARGRRADDGSLAWGAGVAHEHYDLYRGQAGIALFLAALAAVTRQARFTDAATSALDPLARILEAPGPAAPERWASIGGCDGLGSVVYALAASGRLLGDFRWTEAARRWAAEISPARIASDASA